jgi:glycosyltransferase involved in cell wall biosynthesis
VKIHFDNVDLGARSGPNTFASRLARRLFDAGHEVLLDGTHADISLVFIEPTGKPLAPKVVQRLDGIWFKPHEFHTKNQRIQRLYYDCDAVVFQSQFDKSFIEKWWGKSDNHWRPQVVIGNAIEIVPIKEITIPKLDEIRRTYEQVFVCSSNWHAQKRLEANVRLFEHLRKQTPNSCLIIMGDHPDYRAAGMNVFYTGAVGPEVYMQMYSAANWMLHLAWADHCPNVVVEALSQGTPVVCSEVGGTQELIGHGTYGVVLKEQLYDFELYDYDNPPTIDVTQCTSLPTRQELDYAGIPNIDIKVCAEEYLKLFVSLTER